MSQEVLYKIRCALDPKKTTPEVLALLDRLDNIVRERNQFGAVLFGKRLPAPELDQDPAMLAFMLSQLEADSKRLNWLTQNVYVPPDILPEACDDLTAWREAIDDAMTREKV